MQPPDTGVAALAAAFHLLRDMLQRLNSLVCPLNRTGCSSYGSAASTRCGAHRSAPGPLHRPQPRRAGPSALRAAPSLPQLAARTAADAWAVGRGGRACEGGGSLGHSLLRCAALDPDASSSYSV